MSLLRRPRRLRRSETLRSLSKETNLCLDNFIYPLFIIDGTQKKEVIPSMPSIFRFSMDYLCEEIEECYGLGIKSYILFPAIDDRKKDSKASYSYAKSNFYLEAIATIKARFPDICVITDVAMDPYSSDGHDGLVSNGTILNDETLPILSKMALAQAKAGADIIAPSDMMDGRIQFLRKELDANHYQDIPLMAYTAKYASPLYAPFREALDSAPRAGNKLTYQISYTNSREAIVEAELDYQEGADYLLVKPALPYLDIIQSLRNKFNIPIVAYQVSGEYSMLKIATEKIAFNFQELALETLYSIKRAGADIIISYFTKEFALWQKQLPK